MIYLVLQKPPTHVNEVDRYSEIAPSFLLLILFFSLVFVRGRAYDQALSSFQKSGNWRQVFCMASLLQYSDEETISLARTVAGL